MKKIASPTEFQAELRSLMAFVQGHGPDGKPDRQVIAAKLRDLADRVGGDGFMLEAGGSVAEATFKKLKNGDWGLLVNSDRVRSGDKVLAITRNGKRSYKYVGRVVWSGNGVTICTIGAEGGRDKPSEKASPYASPRQVDYAMSLVNKLVRGGGWFDTAFGDGMPPPKRRDLEGMTPKEISQFIDELRSEF